ncbi:MAG: methyltransferase [Bacillota bacterium]|nr:methyltransferase [Bacillota bacterium]
MNNNLSPLRYPGGKTKLYPYIKRIIELNNLEGCTYIEPFAGGSGLALKLLINKDVDHIIINDFDFAIYAFWYSILNETEEFCRKIKNESVDLDQWHYYKDVYVNQYQHNIFDVGYATFFLNRTNRSGIINGGVIGGFEQNGKYPIDCRFNRNVLIEKIKLIHQYRHKIDVLNLDAIDLIRNNIKNYDIDNTFVYLDPPYVKKGPELYQNFFTYQDHVDLYMSIYNNIACPWLVTYDVTDDMSELYSRFKQEIIDINYSAGTNKKGTELAIFSNNLDSLTDKKSTA